MYDSIIIGSGPAGISAALYMARANLKVLIISNGKSSLQKAEKIENYYGLDRIYTGKELYENGIKQAVNLGVEIIQEEVFSINYNENFEVITTNYVYEAKTIIIATGTVRNTPKIKGIKQLEGKGVSYCAICDAFFYKNKDVAVIGSGNYAIHEIVQLKPVVNSVVMLTNGEKPIENRDIEIKVNEKKIREVRGTEKVEEIEFEDNTTQKINGIFIAIGTASSIDLAKKVGIVVQDNKIKVDEKMHTNIPGIFACGDCTGGLLQINKAVYEGAKAGLEAISYLRK